MFLQVLRTMYYGLNPTNNYYLFLFYNFFLHYLPALMIDTYCAITGKRRAMLKLYSKVMKLANILFYFSTQDWKFSDMNVILPPSNPESHHVVSSCLLNLLCFTANNRSCVQLKLYEAINWYKIDYKLSNLI
ncbi:hypothetical protein HF086_014626 [Spodoptera exigua]|uniref:Fatty acyl-CoA reductase C-terminal domain-containing protein n=1 Tax=Spodoptera exigua TaxID=7107 RepID=A0A922M6Z8_SPOEX|nr:hypothetical protein HF086_014626 [Spodoptera exigua]